jgi:hypothetical protein
MSLQQEVMWDGERVIIVGIYKSVTSDTQVYAIRTKAVPQIDALVFENELTELYSGD